MVRRQMNLKHVNSLKGTGTIKEDDSYSPKPFVNYVIYMVKILIVLFLFCYTTTNNYLNAKFDAASDYPVGDTLNSIIKSNTAQKVEPASPYCSSYVACSAVPLDKSEDVSKMSLWLQTTQESCYRLGGMALHYYFNFMQKWCVDSDSGIPYTGIISFVRWVIFGVVTLISMILMMCLVWIIFIPGWFGGLFAFIKIQTNDVSQVALFCLSVFLTICFGWVSIFPVIYEFFYLVYLFLFKQLTSNSDNFGPEFAKRMSNLMIVFVIAAVIVAAMQLPTISAAIIGGIMFLAMLFMKNKSLYKSA